MPETLGLLLQPYVTRSGRSSRPMREWWKVDHPYQHAREQRRA